jgi:hypothetical protein
MEPPALKAGGSQSAIFSALRTCFSHCLLQTCVKFQVSVVYHRTSLYSFEYERHFKSQPPTRKYPAGTHPGWGCVLAFFTKANMQTETLETPEATLRAGINEANFFKNMKHLFASSYSVIGEILQNARRAGATKIDITFGPAQKALSIADDGVGISDFSPLIMMCESNWSTDVTLADKPFGMGLFSAFYAAERVAFSSKGTTLSLTLDDVVTRRELKTTPDIGSTKSKKGTTVTLIGLEPSLLKVSASGSEEPQLKDYKLYDKLHEMCEGFAVPVFLNGVEIERPCALSNGNFEVTDIGHVSIPNVHSFSDNGSDVSSISTEYMRLFCQGLPIGTGYVRTGPIVHLDGMLFHPKMPDRSNLYNEKEALDTIRASIRSTVGRYLLAQKQALSGESFVLKHWDNCQRFGVLHLLNDIPHMPVNCFSQVTSADCDDAFEANWAEKRKLYTHDDFVSGQVDAWRNVPQSLDDSPWAGTALRVMVDKDILALNATMDEGHWVHSVLPDASEFSYVVDFKDMGTDSSKFASWCSDYTAQIFLGSSIPVAITSKVDPAFKKTYELGSWALIPKENEESCTHYFAFVCKQCSDSPVTLFGGLNDEWNDRDSEREEAEEARWMQTVSALKGNPLHQILKESLDTDKLVFSDVHLNQIAFSRVAKNPDPESYFKFILSSETSSPDLYAKIAKQLGKDLTAVEIESAFIAAINPATELFA